VSLRRTPFHRVLYRPALWLGGERELTGSTAVIAIGLAVLGQNLVAFTVAALLWFLAIYLVDPGCGRLGRGRARVLEVLTCWRSSRSAARPMAWPTC